MSDPSGKPPVSRAGKTEIGAKAAGLAWLVFLACWVTIVFVATHFVLATDLALGFRILIVLAGSAAAVALAGYLLLNSPQVKTYRQQAVQFHSFCKAIKKAAGTLDLQEILDSAARIIVEVTGVRGCSIKLLDFKTRRLRARAIVGLEKERSDQALSIVEHIYDQGMMDRQSIIVRDIHMRDFPAVDEQFESLICVPLHLEERLLGAICIFGERGQKLSPQMISLLSSLGEVVSLAIAHALLHEDLRRLIEAKTRFMSQASHELRSPLNTIQSMARTVLDGHLGELKPGQREMISRIDLRAHSLSEIVGDLLVLAAGRTQLSILKPNPVDVQKLTLETVKFFETRAEEKNISLSVTGHLPDPLVYGNQEGLRSVLTNLLSNATKYTPHGGTVAVRLFESKGRIVLEVSDSGIGIPKTEQGTLFTEFFRASNAKAMAENGTGLGLVIVKATVEQHGGSIDLESDEGTGTTFRITLPKAGA